MQLDCVKRNVSQKSPDDVALKRPVLVALRGRLPLDHDGLVGSATGYHCLRRGAGGLLG